MIHVLCSLTQLQSGVYSDRCFEKFCLKGTAIHACVIGRVLSYWVMLERKTWYVYVDRRLDTCAPFYVGKGDAARVRRKERNRYHQNIVARHGIERSIVFETGDEREALDKEIELIKELRTRDYFGGANFTDGGDGVSGYRFALEAIEKNRIIHTGVTHGENTCEKKRRSMLESPAVRRRPVQQVDESGKVIATHGSVSAAARAVGRPDAATLVSRCCRGKVKTFMGFGWTYVEPSATNCARRSHAQRRAVEQVERRSGLVVAVHPSIAAAARSLGKNNVSIRACCHGTRSTAYGFEWRFAVPLACESV